MFQICSRGAPTRGADRFSFIYCSIGPLLFADKAAAKKAAEEKVAAETAAEDAAIVEAYSLSTCPPNPSLVFSAFEWQNVPSQWECCWGGAVAKDVLFFAMCAFSV